VFEPEDEDPKYWLEDSDELEIQEPPEPEEPQESAAPARGTPSRHFGPPTSERQKRFRQRAIPLAVVALISFVVGAFMAASSTQQEAAERFVQAWADQDFAAMYDELGDGTRQDVSLEAFTKAYDDAQVASTATTINPGDADDPENDVVTVEVGVGTNLFGDVEGTLSIPVEGEKLGWGPHLTFPSLKQGERVGRRLELGRRADILADDGTALAEGNDVIRTSSLGTDAIDVAGEVAEPDSELQEKVEQQGYPGDRETGVSGLELAFNSRLAGKPGGELLAVPEGTELPDVPKSVEGRVLATAESEPGQNVKTTIDPDLQQTTVAALGGQSGGIAVLDARSGDIKALAGSAFSSQQPPGSTFKIITATAALEEEAVTLDEQFDVVQEINAGGRVISNASQELCGGSFVESFAHSCNTVFAPLGVEIGDKKLVEVAERYGFNQQPALYNEAAIKVIDPPEPEIPTSMPDDVELAASAIGQGRVLATPLALASISQAVANGGVRKPTSIVSDPELRPETKAVEATDRETAKVMRFLMEQVVKDGTGTAAALNGIRVAGKTGTAELGPDPNQPAPKPLAPGEEPPDPVQILDAWFTAFAPVEKPKYAVAVMLIDAGADGGEVAAPIAAEILDAALR
jgi:beta-lactamase class D